MGERIRLSQKKLGARVNHKTIGLNKTKSHSNQSPVDRILNLQKTIGNQAVTRLIQTGTIQASLKIGQPGDIYEKEADRVADQVMRMPEQAIQRQAEEEEEEKIQTKPLAEQITPLVQRQELPEEEEEPVQAKLRNDSLLQRQAEEEEEEPVQAKMMENSQLQRQEEEEEEISRKASGTTAAVSSDIESRIQSMKGGGQALSESTRAFFEPRFGADFSQVRVHTDSSAAETAWAINAKAFTTGKDIVFGSGQYAPETSADKRLLAHELTHVLQQQSGSLSPTLIQRDCQYFPAHSDPDTYCETRAEAEALVIRANPANCFVYSDGPDGFRWRPIPGFGCAHYVAHELGITEGPAHANCRDGFSVTIAQITQGRTRRALSEAQVNDIWTNDGETHSGVVREVGSGDRAGQVRIQACSVAGNIYSQWTGSGAVHQ